MSGSSWTDGIKAIGFDVDGTLYKMTSEIYNVLSTEIAKVAAEKLGRDETEFVTEYLAKRVELGGNTMTLDSYGFKGQEIYQQVFDKFPIEEFVGRDALLAEMVTKLKQQYRLFIISNGTGRQVERKLKILDLNYLDFEPRIYCYDQGWAKPEKEPFLSAVDKLGLLPEEIVYVGDKEEFDILGAKAVGMRAIMVGGESHKADVSVLEIYGLSDIFLSE